MLCKRNFTLVRAKLTYVPKRQVTVAPAGGIGISRYGDISVTHEDLLAWQLKLLLADITRSVRLSEEVMRVSQHFGALTISFSRCACEKRSADGLRLFARAADRYDDVGVTYPLLLEFDTQ
ncbi:hypothetical protein F511_31768 [Dorcoceras hygrometricum]|uniref:Uncharacterized protein n=1 Tax=Dorcoceras hygrometricum TaxID=472368 RepID=A0A2Z7B0N0_9LAMI|nr:hypothetical protein F511_31768 [Dorcoceras hygrometricum]